MACISCGVITSAWLWRISSLWVSAMLRCTIGPVLAYPVYDAVYTGSEHVVNGGDIPHAQGARREIRAKAPVPPVTTVVFGGPTRLGRHWTRRGHIRKSSPR